jgi:hypothetical protein
MKTIGYGWAGALLLIAGHLRAMESSVPPQPWEKAGISAGVFYSKIESRLRVGVGSRVGVDAENLLALNPDETVFRVDGNWRFSDNRKHRLDLMWFSFHRSARTEVLDDFTIENNEGELVTINAGTTINSYLNIDIYEGSYSYSFFQDDRVDLAARVGLYVMPIGLGVQAEGVGNKQASGRFTAPLPVLGYRLDLALTPRWYIRTGAQFFYIEYAGFKGSLLQGQGALEFVPLKNLAVGLGFDHLNFDLQSQGASYAGVNVNGQASVAYTGLQLYLRTFFR